VHAEIVSFAGCAWPPGSNPARWGREDGFQTLPKLSKLYSPFEITGG
jgi:hypothetical protein